MGGGGAMPPEEPPPTPEPQAEVPAAEVDAPQAAVDNVGAAAALLGALEQEKIEGRARGQARQTGDYILAPLPVPQMPSVKSSSPPRQEPSKPAQPAGSPPSAAGGENACPSCGAANPPLNRFCGECGHRIDIAAAQAAAAPSRPTAAAPLGAGSQAAMQFMLVCINEDGTDGDRLELTVQEHVIGRSADPRFSADPFLSPRHAKLLVNDSELQIEDMSSLNGTFFRLRKAVPLQSGDYFLMGRQLLKLDRFEHQINPKARTADGTRYMGSPAPNGSYKLTQIGIGGVLQSVYCLGSNGAVLGRERGDIIFPSDKYMSSRHAELTAGENNQLYLSDLGSSNGTWLRIARPHTLFDQDYIFLGQQLFRVSIQPR
jgi:pSer/pThr/pTyr-binding forkhead associated (FHA) protein